MNRIYSATYSNVPVYEYNVENEHVMRRRSDHWINATHILKVAGCDKPARTRILEREVQKGVHEKVQGGYGKYQGTWISLEDGRLLAERNGCLDKLLPIFDFQPGDRSPPPAPKHMTAQTSKPRPPRAMAPPRRVPVPQPPQSRMSEVSFDAYSSQVNDEDGADQVTVSSESEVNFPGNIRWPTKSRKRKRGTNQPQRAPQMSQEDQQHLMWSDELLDYFMLQRSDDPPPIPPDPPEGVDLNRPVDEKGNTALHWASAMGDMHLVQTFISRGAEIGVLTNQGATPLIHAVTFTNNWDKQTMSRLTECLYSTVGQRDCCASTVFHHIAASTMSKTKYPIARYYLEGILSKLRQVYETRDVGTLLDLQDENGNTATLLAAKNGARKCVRIMTSQGARVDIPNTSGETAEQYITQLNERRRDRQRQLSSSPVLPPNGFTQHDDSTLKFPPLSSSQIKGSLYTSDAASNLASQLPGLIQSRTEALAAALESELAEKETEAREGERLLEQRRQELAAARKQLLAVSVEHDEMSVNAGSAGELEACERETRRLLEQEQRLALKQSMGRDEGGLSEEMDDNDDDDGSPAARRLAQRATLARELLQSQQEHWDLVEEIVKAQGFAGVGDEKHNAYKRLIMTALGVSAENVETILPDILQELEEAKGDTGDEANVTQADGIGINEEAAMTQVRMSMPSASNVMASNGNVVYAPVQVVG